MADYGKIAYEAYRNHTGGISIVSKQPIPEWDKLPAEIREAWEAAGQAIVHVVSGRGCAA